MSHSGDEERSGGDAVAGRATIGALITVIAVGFSSFELYTGLFGERVELLQRGTCLGFAPALVFLVTASRRSLWRRGG